MSISAFFQSLNCASSRSSSIRRRTSSLGKKNKKSLKSNASDLNESNSALPSAPFPSGSRLPSTNQPDVTQDSNFPQNNRQTSLESMRNGTTSFWDIGNYKYALKRCDNGYKLGTELSEMVAERAKIEENYAKSLKQWYKKWNDHLESDSAEYQSTKQGWAALLETGNKTADVHLDTCKELVNRPVFKIKDWLKKKYEKHIINYKQTKEFENEFENAEKSWVELNDKLKKHKKEYYESIKTTKQNEETARSAQSNPKINQEQREKLDEKAKKSRDDEERARKRYKDTLTEMELYKPHHMSKMSEVFGKTQNFEQERILFFKQTLFECHEILEKESKEDKFAELFEEFMEHINNVNPNNDLEWWSQNFGADTKPNWPAFEEYQGFFGI